MTSRTYQPPPQCVGVGVEVLRFGLSGGVFMAGHVHGDIVLLHQVDQEGRQDQRQEADVPGRDQFLHTHVHSHTRYLTSCQQIQTHTSTVFKTLSCFQCEHFTDTSTPPFTQLLSTASTSAEVSSFYLLYKLFIHVSGTSAAFTALLCLSITCSGLHLLSLTGCISPVQQWPQLPVGRCVFHTCQSSAIRL